MATIDYVDDGTLKPPTNVTPERAEELLNSRMFVKQWADRYPEIREQCVAICYYQLSYMYFMDMLVEKGLTDG